MDAEKLFQSSSTRHNSHLRPTTPPTITFIRAAQYVWSTLALVFIACAIDRNVLIPGVTADEKALAASCVLSSLLVLYHFVATHRRKVAAVVDAVAAAFLFATFVYGAYNASQRQGACALPSKIGAGITRVGVHG